MNPATNTYLLLRAFVDELARCGMRVACTSPGSRCAPLVLTLAREPRLACYSHIDERCAGFFALGAAKASGLPVAVTCTSGTAAAELAPAAIEAFQARVPLLILTADRPAELRENGAGQAIDQLKLYGGAAKWFFEADAFDDASPARLRWIRTLACRAYWTALDGRPGVVHLNFPLREPLVTDEPVPAEDATARPGGAPYVRRTPSPDAHAAAAAARLTARLMKLTSAAKRGVVVAGRHERWPMRGCERSECLPDRSPLGEAAARFCEAAGWPLLADPMSGARRGAAAVAHYDALLRDEAFVDGHRPDLVIRVGDLPVSKPLRTWLAGLPPDVSQIALDPEGAWQDPASVLSESLALEPAAALRELRTCAPPADPGWLSGWRVADDRAARAIGEEVAGAPLSEPAVAVALGELLPAEATLWVASSMPVRDIETFWPARDDPPRVLCNRGANGIDGTVSSAFGAAAVSGAATGGPVALLIGDVAFAHDIGGLLAATRLGLGLRLTIVLLDNGGGGIFDFLPVSRTQMARAVSGAPGEHDVYTTHIATPTGLDFERAAALYGLAYKHVATIAHLRAAMERALASSGGSTTLVHIHTDRSENVALHGNVWSAVARALAG